MRQVQFTGRVLYCPLAAVGKGNRLRRFRQGSDQTRPGDQGIRFTNFDVHFGLAESLCLAGRDGGTDLLDL